MDPQGPDDVDPAYRGKTILTALYLCMLGVCCIVPVFFYFRMHCDERHNRHLQDLEIAGMTQAMNESQDLHREESKAAQRKYREERRARFIQLFTPVRMILTEENFIRLETDDSECESRIQQTSTTEEMVRMSNDENDETPQQSTEIQDDLEAGTTTTTSTTTTSASGRAVVKAPDPPFPDSDGGYNYDNDDDDDTFILVPKPGLPDGASIYEFNTNYNTNPNVAANNNKTITNNQDSSVELRKVPNECSICLCEYTVGSDIVWSSNPQCDHVFHENCIEQWLMKQRDGPLCPCCRRDFVIDPFDFGPGEFSEDIENKGTASINTAAAAAAAAGDRINIIAATAAVDGEDAIVAAAALTAAALAANSMSRMDESDGGSSSSDNIAQEAVL